MCGSGCPRCRRPLPCGAIGIPAGDDAARALRSALHGLTALEDAGAFGMPRDVTRSLRFLLDTLIAGLQADLVNPAREPYRPLGVQCGRFTVVVCPLRCE
ncbi:TetR-like C-terminal domain-containing protein [Streptomyces sp. EMB24]|uniref:TetR-like C-terminal domain-containing protein n=1 Tax=Streptomyces sp. EMB24 TaxID=2835531 RepID=UPI003FA372FA